MRSNIGTGSPPAPRGEKTHSERGHLAAILPDHDFPARVVLDGDQHFALVARQRPRRAIGFAIDVGIGGVEVDAQEVVVIAGVGRGGPSAAEQFWIGHQQPQHGPAAGGVSGQQAAGGLGVHAVLTFQVGDQFGRQRLGPRPIVDAVDELTRAGGARLVDSHPDHRRRLARFHLIPPGDGGVVERAQRATEALGVVDRRIALAGMRPHSPAVSPPSRAGRRAGPRSG